MSKELDYKMPDEDILDEMLVDCHQFFRDMVMKHQQALKVIFMDAQLIDTSIHTVSLAMIGMLMCYPFGGSVICQDVSTTPAGRAATEMIWECTARAADLKDSLVDFSPDGTLH